MAKGKRERNVLVMTGTAALVCIAVNLIVSIINKRKRKKNMALLGSNIHINLTASEILKLADHVILKSKEVHDSVASVSLDRVSFMNVILPLAELEAQQFPLIQSCVLPKMVSMSEEINKACAEAEKRIDAHLQMCRKREDVYRVVKAFAAKNSWMNPDDKKYINCLVRDFERSGLNLIPNRRQEVEQLRSKIDDLSMQYIKNLNEDTSFLLFADSELDGLPPEFIKSLIKEKGSKLKVTMKTHHVSPILEHCRVGSTRKKVAIAYGQRCGEVNLQILEKLVQMRHRLAELLGYSNYSEYTMESRMPKTSMKVFQFLEDLSVNLTNLASRELNQLRKLKKEEEGDSPFEIHDLAYYMKRAEEKTPVLDCGSTKPCFPVTVVLSGTFKVFQDLFGLRFEEVVGADVWHDGVHLYSVLDSKSAELLGYFYLDIYSREGKYGHTCVLPLQNGCCLKNGTRQVPMTLLISHFPEEIDGNPGLLRFSEVVKLFHEFTHVVHHICNHAPFARLSRLAAEADFVEIPGKLLENWCYESSTLKLITGFHELTKDDLCKSFKRRRNSFIGLKMKQEILIGLVDQIIHSSANMDILELLKHLHPKVMLGIPLLEGTNPASCFPCFAVGYETSCYSHIWSEVFAADIFSSKFRDDLYNQNIGMQFREKVLGPGASKDPLEAISDFLGREPSIQSYIESKSNEYVA